MSDLGNFVFGKAPPQALDIEEAVLGACLVDKSGFGIANRIIYVSEIFYKKANQNIFEAMSQLLQKSMAIDMLTVMEQMKKSRTLKASGGAVYLAGLTNKIGSAANVEAHCRILLQKYIGRKLIEVSSKAIDRAYKEADDPLELLDKIHKTIYTIQGSMSSKAMRHTSEIIPAMTKKFVELRLREDGIVGVPSGLKSLDRVTGGWQSPDFIVLCARPGMGKTAFAMTMVRHMIMTYKLKVGFFSLEMSAEQLLDRIIASQINVSSRRFRDPKKLNVAQADAYINAANSLVDHNLFIDDTAAIRISEASSKARELKETHDIDLIVIDYLQLMRGHGKSKGNREQEVGEISRGLKAIAKELNIPVIALAQLSRATETRGGAKRPMLSDLRESGSIEQDADVVAGIYRPEYYGIKEDSQGRPLNGLTEIIFLKHRNGPLATVQLQFKSHLTNFLDVNDQPHLSDEEDDTEEEQDSNEDLPF